MSDKEHQKILDSLGVPKDSFIMVFPARLDKNKNQKFLINVMKKIDKNTNVHLLLPGEDRLNGYYQNIANKSGLQKYIHFLGYRTDIPLIQKIADISVSSSLREGLPLNVMEAAVAGKPVVALRCRGMEDLIDNGINGFLVEPNKKDSEEKFVQYIKQYINGHSYIPSEKSKNIDLDSITKHVSYIYGIKHTETES